MMNEKQFLLSKHGDKPMSYKFSDDEVIQFAKDWVEYKEGSITTENLSSENITDKLEEFTKDCLNELKKEHEEHLIYCNREISRLVNKRIIELTEDDNNELKKAHQGYLRDYFSITKGKLRDIIKSNTGRNEKE